MALRSLASQIQYILLLEEAQVRKSRNVIGSLSLSGRSAWFDFSLLLYSPPPTLRPHIESHYNRSHRDPRSNRAPSAANIVLIRFPYNANLKRICATARTKRLFFCAPMRRLLSDNLYLGAET